MWSASITIAAIIVTGTVRRRLRATATGGVDLRAAGKKNGGLKAAIFSFIPRVHSTLCHRALLKSGIPHFF
ncbi:hypothetical protein ABTE06_22610, partial [Acinetobacter baumannii]